MSNSSPKPATADKGRPQVKTFGYTDEELLYAFLKCIMTHDDIKLYNALSKFGRPVTKPIPLLRGTRLLHRVNDGYLEILLSPEERTKELKRWNQKEFYRALDVKGMSKDELQPLLVDVLGLEALVLYQESDQSF